MPFLFCRRNGILEDSYYNEQERGSGWTNSNRNAVPVHPGSFTSFTKRGRNHVFLFLDILSHSGDIGNQTRKLCQISPNFACFGSQIFGG